MSVATLLSFEEALETVLAHASPLPSELVPVAEAAGRVLAKPALATVDLPPFAASAMDGYAVRAADTPGPLNVVFRIAAGHPSPNALGEGEAMGIATGGVVPEGSDAVVPIEEVTETGDAVEVPAVAPGAHVRPVGRDITRGETVTDAGVRLGPAQLGALAAAGVAVARCAVRPRIAVLTTGSELRPPGEELGPGQVYEANGIMLAALLRSEGALVDVLPAVIDDEAAHREAIAEGLARDVLVTSGGVSVGPHDLVRTIEAELGVEELFWGVSVKPGKPVSFGTKGTTLVFGLPGNPVSSLVTCELFVRPAVRALSGEVDPGPRFETGALGAPARQDPRRDAFLRARVSSSPSGPVLTPVTGQESHMIARAALAGALVHVPRGDGELGEGSPVRYVRTG
jgi:molybdopterin molybdotransferase